MRIIRFSVFVMLVVALLSPVLLASGFENSGLGMKARGMSGAFRAVASDWSAAYYNPAGYAFINDNQLGADFAFMHYRNELTPNYEWPGGSEWDQPGIYNGANIYNFHEVLSNPSIGFIARLPLWGETVFGLSGYQPFDNNISWQLYDHNTAYNDSLISPGEQYINNLDVVAFQFTAAKEFIDSKLSIGIGLQLLRADLLFKDVIFRDNPYWDNLPAQYQTQLTRKITEFSSIDGNGWGLGFRGGALYKVNEKTNLAVTFNVPLSITVTGESVLKFHLPDIPSYHGDSVQITNPGQPGNLFVAGAELIDSADFETTLNLPVSFGFGLSYKVNDKFTLSADAEYTNWSSFDGFEFAFSNHRGLPTSADTSAIVSSFVTADLSNPVEWDNTIKLMAGIDYTFADYLTIVGGTVFDQSPIRDIKQTIPQFVDTGNKLGISGGLIFHIQQWDLGLVTAYTKADDLTVDGLNDLDNDGNFDSFAGDYVSKTYETVLSINYRF